MTEKEAIKFLQERTELINSDYPEIQDYKEALEIAIKALEKQVPGKPEKEGEENILCSACGSFLGYEVDCKEEEYQCNYCGCCGQRLDWSDNK